MVAHSLVAGTDGGAADQGGGMLRHEHVFATEQIQDGVDGVAVKDAVVRAQNGLDRHGKISVVDAVGPVTANSADARLKRTSRSA